MDLCAYSITKRTTLIMDATELLCNLLGIPSKNLTTQENLILEAVLFTRICDELKEIFRAKNKNYFSLINISMNKENTMLEAKFLSFLINDILMTEEYSIEGIAYHTQIPEDAICDIVSGKNVSPSLQVSRKILDLHRKVRPDLYKEVVKKITTEYLTTI